MRVILTGATGAAGLGILRNLLTDDGIAHVTILARRPLPAWVVLPGGTSPSSPETSPTHPKLNTIVLSSFHVYPASIFSEHDACIWALGKSKRGMTEKDYTEMTVGYVDSFLDAAKAANVGSTEEPFRFAFISGGCVDLTEKSNFLYSRVKGIAENHLIKFAEESKGTFEAMNLRPGYFFPSLNYPNDALNIRSTWERAADQALGGLGRAVAGITVEDIGAFATEAAKGTWDGKGGPIFENWDMKRLLKNLGKIE